MRLTRAKVWALDLEYEQTIRKRGVPFVPHVEVTEPPDTTGLNVVLYDGTGAKQCLSLTPADAKALVDALILAGVKPTPADELP